MKRVAILGGGPAGAFAAQQLAATGLKVQLFDEKLAWEKPCGGGLTHKAYSQYPFLIENSTPKRFVTESVLAATDAGQASLKLKDPLLIYSRFELNRLLLERAERAGAQLEKVRVMGMERSGARWLLRTKSGIAEADFCIVATGARNPLRGVGTQLAPADTMSALGYYVAGDQARIDIQFLPPLEGYIWIFPRCGHLSVGICGKGESASSLRLRLERYMTERGIRWKGSPFYSHLLPSLETASWRKNRVSGEGWMAVGDAAGLVDPITGEGLYYAIRSADLAARALLSDACEPADKAMQYRRLLRRDFTADLEFGSRLAKRIFQGRFLFGSVPARMVQFTRHSHRFSGLMQDLFAGTQPYRGLKRRLLRNWKGGVFDLCVEFGVEPPDAAQGRKLIEAVRSAIKSGALFRRAQELIPGGVNSPVRAFRSVGGQPLFIARGQGSHIFDVDGNEYIDYVGSWGPLLLGHRHPEIIAALEGALEIGTSFGAPTAQEIDLAEAICDAVPSIQMVRLVNSGTEATMSAIRLARAFTGRDLIVKFDGCYHGHVDSLLVQAGSGMATLGIADTRGVPQAFCGTTISLPYNSVEAAERAFDTHRGLIAAVIVEPVAGNMGCVPPAPGFLEGLREITRREGALLIFDEVMTGFRVAFGGAQALYGVAPDLTTLGKVIGGGLPVGAYGGREDIMRLIAPAGAVYQAGTLSGNPLAVAAGLAMLRHLKAHPEVYSQLESRAAELCGGAPSGITVNRVGSMFTMFFTDRPVTDYESAKRSDTAKFGRFFQAMLERGMYLAPSQFEAAFLSTAHSEEDIRRTVAAADESFHAAVNRFYRWTDFQSWRAEYATIPKNTAKLIAITASWRSGEICVASAKSTVTRRRTCAVSGRPERFSITTT